MNLRYRNERAPSAKSEASSLSLPAWIFSFMVMLDGQQLTMCLHCSQLNRLYQERVISKCFTVYSNRRRHSGAALGSRVRA